MNRIQLCVAQSLVLATLVTVFGASCARTRFTPQGEQNEEVHACSDDTDCEEGYICVFDECIPVEEYNCKGDQAPIVKLDPPNVEFGNVIFGSRFS